MRVIRSVLREPIMVMVGFVMVRMEGFSLCDYLEVSVWGLVYELARND